MYRVPQINALRRHGSGASLFPAVAYAIAGAAAWSWQGKAPAILFPVSCILFAAAVLKALDWFREFLTKVYQATLPPDKTADEVRIVEAVRGMDANQVWLAAYMLGYKLDEGDPGKSEATIENTDIEKSFAISQTDTAAARQGYLAPVRTFSDGSTERRQMELLVNWLVSQGLAEPAAGNKPARLLDHQQARERILA